MQSGDFSYDGPMPKAAARMSKPAPPTIEPPPLAPVSASRFSGSTKAVSLPLYLLLLLAALAAVALLSQTDFLGFVRSLFHGLFKTRIALLLDGVGVPMAVLATATPTAQSQGVCRPSSTGPISVALRPKQCRRAKRFWCKFCCIASKTSRSLPCAPRARSRHQAPRPSHARNGNFAWNTG